MELKTRIGTNIIAPDSGSIGLPEEVTLCCPQCGTPVADKGQCLAEFDIDKDADSKTGYVLKVVVDCRSCGCFGRQAAVKR